MGKVSFRRCTRRSTFNVDLRVNRELLQLGIFKGPAFYSDGMCSICREDIRLNDYIKVLNCRHIFHKECILKCAEFGWPQTAYRKSNKLVKINEYQCPVCGETYYHKFYEYPTGPPRPSGILRSVRKPHVY